MNQGRPRVSIGVPVYNSERYLAETLDCLLAQTFSDFELIISDNASSDGTEEIGRAHAARDPRVRYYRAEKNLGAAWNYRRAFELSSGEYFKWHNYDDLCTPEFVARCIEVLDQNPDVVLAYPKTKLIDEHGEILSEYEDRLHLASPRASERFIQFIQSVRLVNALYGLVRSGALRRTGLHRNFVGGDIPILAELTLYGQFWEIPEFMFFRRMHPQASSAMTREEQFREFFDPARKNQATLRGWRHLWTHFQSVWRAPLAASEKLHVDYFLLRRAIWNRGELAQELSQAVSHAARRKNRN